MRETEAARVMECLRKVPLFRTLPDDRLAWISERGEKVGLQTRSKIASQGDPADGFYVVLEGETEWTRRVDEQEFFVMRLGKGSIFAEFILILDAPYPATGHAATDAKLLKLGVEDFWETLKICPEVLRGILVTSVERAEMHESVSQQHAKLISLGSIAAGLAHELNNPAAAVARSAQEAREASSRAIKLGGLGLGEGEREFVSALPEETARRRANAPSLDSLERGDLEDEVALWLEERGVEEAWEVSPTLVGAGLNTGWLEELEGRFSNGEVLGAVIGWLAAEVSGDELLREIHDGSSRISELVRAVKSYSRMDKASSKEVDVHEGLESTLLMFGHKLKEGDLEVRRDYDQGLPKICAYGGELNRVWTNLMDNAIDAVNGHGCIGIRTAREGHQVLVEISDGGPGIPEGARDRIFEPFFTTKDVGKGSASAWTSAIASWSSSTAATSASPPIQVTLASRCACRYGLRIAPTERPGLDDLRRVGPGAAQCSASQRPCHAPLVGSRGDREGKRNEVIRMVRFSKDPEGGEMDKPKYL